MGVELKRTLEEKTAELRLLVEEKEETVRYLTVATQHTPRLADWPTRWRCQDLAAPRSSLRARSGNGERQRDDLGTGVSTDQDLEFFQAFNPANLGGAWVAS